MNRQRWIGAHPFLFTWFVIIAARRVVPWIIDNHENLLPGLLISASLVGLIVLVFRRIPTAARPKLDIAYWGHIPLREGARCLVCRDALSGEVVYCGRCHTPHHRECFAYAGACSVYACGSRKAA